MGDYSVRKFFQRKPFWAIAFIMIVAYFVLYSANRVTCKADPALMIEQAVKRAGKNGSLGNKFEKVDCCTVKEFAPKNWNDRTRYLVLIREEYVNNSDHTPKKLRHGYIADFDKCGEELDYGYTGG
jgi:hypothetical protein